MAPTPIEKNVFSLIDPIVAELGCQLLDVEMTSDAGGRVLRVYVDREGGVGLDDCSRVSSAIEDIIDVKECVPGSYNLEVSSPGLDRPLRKKEHFEQVVGKMLRITTVDKIDGRQNFKGLLEQVSGNTLSLHVDKQSYTLPLEQVRKARLIYENSAK